MSVGSFVQATCMPTIYTCYRTKYILTLVCNFFHLFQIPFTLTLRFYDVFMLEGDKMLCAAAYTILKLHKSKFFS